MKNNVELINLYWTTAGIFPGVAEISRLLTASEALQAKHIKIGDFYNSVVPMPRISEAFAALCQEAENYGATIAFEFMASAMIDNLQDALAMVETAGAKNGGLALDIGYTGPWAVEVISNELVGLPLAELNRRAYETTIAQFEE